MTEEATPSTRGKVVTVNFRPKKPGGVQPVTVGPMERERAISPLPKSPVAPELLQRIKINATGTPIQVVEEPSFAFRLARLLLWRLPIKVSDMVMGYLYTLSPWKQACISATAGLITAVMLTTLVVKIFF